MAEGGLLAHVRWHGLLQGPARRTLAWARAGAERVEEETGGPARTRVVAVLATVLALDAADRGAVAAIAGQLERSLHIDNTQIGLMVTVSSLVAAAATVPMGALVDRVHRVRLLWVAMVVWAVAQVLSGLAPSYEFLLGARILLGLAIAAAGPAVASLTGDLFPPNERGRMWSFILTGEVLGTGIGVVYAGEFGSLLSWRAAFFALAVPTLAMAWGVHKILPEPARGGRSRLPVGATEIPSEDEVADRPPGVEGASEGDPGEESRDSVARRVVTERGIEPAEEIVVAEDPASFSIWQAIRYVLRVRTNWVLIIASSLGYFFLSGLETFALIFLEGHFGVSHAVATLLVVIVGAGIIGGILVAGHVGDRWMRRGHIERRILIGVVGFMVAVVALAPGIVTTALFIAVPLFVVAGFALAAPNPGLDAARLDVMPARMWGRSEGVRTLLRQSLEGFAPLIFGLVSQAFGAPTTGFGAGVNSSHTAISAAQTQALEYTFLVMLAPILVGAGVLLLARRSYPVDVASALESERRLKRARATRAGEGQAARAG